MLLTAIFLHFFQPAYATSCKQELLLILKTAKNNVNANLVAGSNCHTAALIGRKNGLPGCTQLQDIAELKALLTPLFHSAKNTCKNTCAIESAEEFCSSLVTKNNLRHYGINGIVDIINNSDEI